MKKNKDIHLFFNLYIVNNWLYLKYILASDYIVYIRIEDRSRLVRKIKTFLKELLEKKREQKDIQNFLCNLPGDCSKIPKKYIWSNLYKNSFNKKRFFKPEENYSWKDWIETQEGVNTYKERIKKLNNDEVK